MRRPEADKRKSEREKAYERKHSYEGGNRGIRRLRTGCVMDRILYIRIVERCSSSFASWIGSNSEVN